MSKLSESTDEKKLQTGFESIYEEFIYKRSYSRWLEKEKRRETWDETVDRYKDFFIQRVPDRHKEEYQFAIEQIRRLEVMPSMRALWTAGKALEREHLCSYNCAFAPIDSIKTFADMMYILMCGTGFGFSVERQYINCLPEIPSKFITSDKEIVFADSKKGWAEGYFKVLKSLYKGVIPEYNLEKIRPAGARLKVFGGRASGPDPLDKLLKFTINMITNNPGRKLSSINCYDICCMIADIVVSGGVRRAACLSFSNLSDDRMAKAKSGSFWIENPQRQLANNSTAFTEKPSSQKFLSEWIKLIESRTGERGIYNREGAKFQILKSGRRKIDFDFGSNPSLRKGTKVWTSEGITPIEKLQDKEFTVKNLNGELSDATCFLSGKNKNLYKINLVGGHSYYSTAQHEWPVWNGKYYEKIRTDNIKDNSYIPIIKNDKVFTGSVGTTEDGFFCGWLFGDGWITQRADNNKQQIGLCIGKKDYNLDIETRLKAILSKNGSKASFTNRSSTYELNTNNNTLNSYLSTFGIIDKNSIPKQWWHSASENFIRGFIDGLFSSDGSISKVKKGKNNLKITLTTSKKEIAKSISEILGFYGIKTLIVKTIVRDIKFPNGKRYNKEYTSYRLHISTLPSIQHFCSTFNISVNHKKNRLLNVFNLKIKQPNVCSMVKIKSVEKTDLYEDVWDISVKDETHCFQLAHCITGNCGEINLRPCQTCNLSEGIIRKEDSLEDLKKKVRGATILGCVQSTLTDFKFVGRKWKQNCEEERLLGVSLTGVMDHPILNTKSKTMEKWFHELKEEAIQTAEIWSKRLGINMPTAITTEKPSGSVSQLCNTSSGVHTRYAPFYIRRVRVASTDTLAKFLIGKGVPYKPETGFTLENALNLVFEFPIKSPETSRMRDEITAIDQLEFYKTVMQYWVEHNISTTIYVKEDEWPEVAAWVFKNWNSICGLSFLPYDTGVYELAPYQEISEEEYYDILESFPKDIDFNDLNEMETKDGTEGAAMLACMAGGCEL